MALVSCIYLHCGGLLIRRGDASIRLLHVGWHASPVQWSATWGHRQVVPIVVAGSNQQMGVWNESSYIACIYSVSSYKWGNKWHLAWIKGGGYPGGEVMGKQYRSVAYMYNPPPRRPAIGDWGVTQQPATGEREHPGGKSNDRNEKSALCRKPTSIGQQ